MKDIICENNGNIGGLIHNCRHEIISCSVCGKEIISYPDSYVKTLKANFETMENSYLNACSRIRDLERQVFAITLVVNKLKDRGEID